MMRHAPSPMTPEEIREILESYHSPLPRGIEAKVQKYMELMEFWGRKMSLTSVHDHEEILRFHFGESIFALTVVKFQESRLADVGTGAGFPGLALKLAVPELQVMLVESNKKKCAFLHEVIRTVELENVAVIPSGYDSAGIPRNSLPNITCRALGIEERLLNWSRESLASGGALVLWVGDEDCQKLRRIQGWSWTTPALIPRTKGRYILAGRPMRP